VSTTLTDLTPAVIAYLLAQAAANPALGAAATPVIVIDGQPATQDVLVVNETGLTQWLWIGSDGLVAPGSMSAAASSEQAFSFLDQARTRDDKFSVQCAAEAVAGDGVMAEARAGAYAVMAAVELMLRGSPGTNPASPGDASMGGLVFWSEVTGPIELEQGQRDAGAGALVKFKVTGFVRLTS
jgi:hypothetical protein